MLTIQDIERMCNHAIQVAPTAEGAFVVIREELVELEKYNGWPNRETWLVNLWLTNEQGSNDSCREIAKDAADNAIREGNLPNAIKPNEIALNRIAGAAIREGWVAVRLDAGTVPNRGMFVDLIAQALNRVDWEAIGAAFREE